MKQIEIQGALISRCAFYIYRINTCVYKKIRYNHMAYEFVASIVQRLECKPSKLEMRVRFPLLAPQKCVGQQS